MEWLNSLEDQLKSSLSSDVPKSDTTIKSDVSLKLTEKPEERKNDMDEIFNKKNMPVLLLAAFAIAVITWFNYQEKLNNQLSNNLQLSDQQTDLNQQVPPWYQNNNNSPSINNSPSLDKKVELLTIGTQKIWERTKWNTDAVILLSIINNNNSFVLKNNYPKSELIFLNSDWTINKMPTAVQLDDEDKEFLKKFIR